MDDQDDAAVAPAPKPAWAVAAELPKRPPLEPPADPEPDFAPPRPRKPAGPENDGLWTHVTEVGGIASLLTWLAAIALPHTVPIWMIAVTGAALTAVTWWVALDQTTSLPVPFYLAAWGAMLTGWITLARFTSPFKPGVAFALILTAVVLIPLGPRIIRRHRLRARIAVDTGLGSREQREAEHWHGLLQRMGVTGAAIRGVVHVDGGYQVHGRLGRATADGRKPSTMSGVRELAELIGQHKRLPKGAVYIEEVPPGRTSADFIIHVRTATGPRLARWLPADNRLLSVNRALGLGLMDNGREFALRFREYVVFICGLRGSGKSTLLNVITAQMARCPDVLIFMIDLKGGQEARAWMMPWLRGWTDEPVIHWLATTREEAKIMLDAVWAMGKARAESGRYGRKLRPDPDQPAIIIICDETAIMTGHKVSEDGIRNSDLTTRLVQIAETFRSVAIDPVVAAVRAFVDITGSTGLKAMAEVRIGMKVASPDEGAAIFPGSPAAKQLAELTDKGMGIPKVGAELFPPVHFYNISDGEPDDDGHPTMDRITPVAIFGGQREHMARLEPFVAEAGGEAYANRWETEHMKALLETWRQADGWAGEPAPEEPGPAAPAGEAPAAPLQGPPGNDVTLSDREEEIFAELAMMADPEVPGFGPKLSPDRKRMRELLIAHRVYGLQVNEIVTLMGGSPTRQTITGWLRQDEQLGYVLHISHGKNDNKARWKWRLPPGAEFDIPGMEG